MAARRPYTGPLARPQRSSWTDPSFLLAQNVLEQPEVMSTDQLPPDEQPDDMVVAPQGAQPAPPQDVQLSPGEMVSYGLTEKTLGPQAAPFLSRSRELEQQIGSAGDAAKAEQQAGIDEMAKDIQDYDRAKSGIDWRPLAALLDQWQGGGNLYRLASDLAPESPEVKRAKLMEMKRQLQGAKGVLSKDQLAHLKEQLDANLGILKEMSNERRLAKKEELDWARIGATQGRFEERQVQALAKATEGRANLDAALGELNTSLGFDIDQYDPKTNTVGGKKIDLPGASLPGVGRVAFYNERAREIEDTMSRVFNTELKDRSGAAVTNQELVRLKNEFSSGRFQTEPEKIKAVQRYKRLLLEQLNRQESAFSKGVRQTYQERIKSPEAKMSGGTAQKTGSGPGGKLNYDEWKAAGKPK